MDRRGFFTAARTGKKSASVEKKLVTGRTNTGTSPYTGPWTKNETIHLLKRTMFGATLPDIQYFSGLTMEDAVNELLNITEPLPAPPLKDYDTSNADEPDNGVAPGTTWVYDHNADDNVGDHRKLSLKRWWVGRILNQERSIREKMTLFWHNHFATEMIVTKEARYAYKHHTLLRENALGNFKALAKAITVDPLMLIYQNGAFNRRGAPDENYARELQELFTLGKENNPNYTEDDVKAAARVLTGWRTNAELNETYFDAGRHDPDDKVFSSFYNNTVIRGRSGETAGQEELDDLIDMIFNKSQEASRYIVKELYRWFVYYEVDAAADANVITPLAQMLVNHNWNIKPVVEALLKSEHFFDVLNQGCLIKSPVDFALGLCREFNVQLPDASDYATQYAIYAALLTELRYMQQNLGDPPSVSGWPAYYQIPLFHEIWINNDTYPKRTYFTDTMIFSSYTRNGFDCKIDCIAFAKSLSNPGDPNVLLNDSLEILYRIPLSDNAKQQLKKDILLTGQTNDLYWTNAWNTYIANPADMAAYQTVFSRLNELYKYLLALPEYHLS
ncbi:MAG: DUF1800 domain-containing protein [Chitinophagaceae bacterium]|nr:DUF1800 domain-containing protein [Chitinophagaceae bacterium]